MDDLEDDSNYLVIDKLKKTFVKHWKRLCELQARNPTTGRPVDKKFKCEGNVMLQNIHNVSTIRNRYKKSG